MTRAEALVLVGELQAMVDDGPGGMTESVRARLSQIIFAFHEAVESRDGGADFRAKALEACEDVQRWRGSQWQRLGSETHARAAVAGTLGRLRNAIREYLQQGGGR